MTMVVSESTIFVHDTSYTYSIDQFGLTFEWWFDDSYTPY